MSGFSRCFCLGFSLVSDEANVVPKSEGAPIFPMINNPILDEKYPSEIVKDVKLKTNCGNDGCQSSLKIKGFVPTEIIAGKDVFSYLNLLVD